MQTLNLSIEGMHCGGCANRVSAALKSAPGTKVEQVTVGSARLSIDPAKTSAAALIKVLDDLGFTAAVKSNS